MIHTKIIPYNLTKIIQKKKQIGMFFAIIVSDGLREFVFRAKYLTL